MAFTHVCLLVTLVTYTLSLPLARNSEVQIVQDAVYTPVDPLVNLDLIKSHRIVRRSKRAGIIHGGECPEGEWHLPNGQCAPCQGQNNPECDGDGEKDDYYDENAV